MGEAQRRGRLIAIVAGLCLSLGGAVLFAQDPPDEGFVGNAQARTFHKTTCKLAEKITAKNKVELGSLDEAMLQKFKPCTVCKPNQVAAPVAKPDEEKPDGDMPKPKAKTIKKGAAKGAAKKTEPAPAAGDDEKTEGDMPKSKTKKGAAKGALKKADASADGAPGEMDAEKADGAMPTKAKGKRATGKAVMKKGDTAKKADVAKKAEPEPVDDKALKFSRDIAPILAGNCTGCHNAQQKRGQFDMTSFQKLMTGSSKQKVITPGNPDESLLVLKVRGEQPAGGKMPPGQRNLAPETIAKLEEWIKSGARLDAGFEPTATLDSIAPTPEARRRRELAAMTPEQRDKKVEEVGLERWKKASSKTTPVVTSGKNFLLFSNLPKERAERLLKTMEVQRTTLGSVLGQSGTALTGLEKISLFVFNDLPSYVEFVRSVENREVDATTEAHGRLDVEQPYVAVADPLNGGEESAAAAAAASGGTPKKTAKSKKAKDSAEETHDGPDRTLPGIVSEHLAASAAMAGGKPPKWLTTGLGAFLSSKVDPKGSNYYRKLREDTVAQFNLGWETKASELLGGEGSPETVRAIGFSLCEWLATSFGPQRFAMFVQGMLQGGEKLDDVVRGCFGPDATRAVFLDQWGGFIGTRYAGRRR
ncbi:MAG: Planctomycete cytochrome [Planctomycetota bacterium]|nr:Planctomycete cytochrome [Planctomycetota bacterium]